VSARLFIVRADPEEEPPIPPARPLRCAAETPARVAEELDIPALYRRYGDLVLGRCRTILRNDADAHDAMQEVFLKLHRFRDAFRGESSPSTFLYRITTTTCLNRIRSARRRPEDPVAELPPLPATDSVLDTLALRQLLDQLLADSDPTTRECLVYHFVDGMTHDEVGEMVGLSGAAVRKRIAGFRNQARGEAP
jgi:RNA polymerase sigma-70 factor (ECF subfamily)